MTPAEPPTRIALLGIYGGGNLGDGAIWESLIAGIRGRISNAEIVAFTCNPVDTRARHGLEAFNLRWQPDEEELAESGDDARRPPLTESERRRPVSVRRTLGKALPGLKHFWWDTRLVALNLMQHGRNRHHLRDLDLVVVAGGGQFDSLFGGPLTHPVTLWRWGEMASRAGVPYVILSVGTGTLSPPSRLFLRRALSLADFASFRDPRSQELIGGTAAARAKIVPDLAYALPMPADTALTSRRSDPAVVGISPMAYADPRFYPLADPVRFRRHLHTLDVLTCRLLRDGHEVVLFTSDHPDELPKEELREMVAAKVTVAERERLRAPSVGNVEELMDVLNQVDVVVSARLHGVLLSHVAGRPALGIAHERKVATLMAEMDQSQYCQSIDEFDVERGWSQLSELMQRREELVEKIRAQTLDRRRRVEEQYDTVFGRP
jgi:polysaccharide pyruvyl transferase WcaK-like protein